MNSIIEPRVTILQLHNIHQNLMKRLKMLQAWAALALTIAAFAPSGFAAISIPSNGSDGALNITTSTNIDLGMAVTGPWDTNNTANAGKGVYDPDKWAIVFKYTSVNIANGVTVTFKNHASRAPVVWLVSGNVTNNGTVNLNGAPSDTGTVTVPEGGPGGFRGGARQQDGLSTAYTAGFGPGGSYNAAGEYGPGQQYSYGNSSLVPLIGGSGGAANGNYNGNGGGGAILIAASGTIQLSGTISAADGSGGPGYRGSGGAVRLLADQILGAGTVAANGQNPGRVRLQANVVSQFLSVNPIVQRESPTPVVIWPATNAPSVRVVSVSEQNAPRDPRAVIENNPADVTIASSSPVAILLETTNFPTNGTVNVFIKPRNGVLPTYQASWLSGSGALSLWQLQTNFPAGYSVIQARAVAP